MKKIISVLCVLAMMASFACIGASAADVPVTFSVVADDVKPGDTEINAMLVVTLPEGATGYELGAFKLEVAYDASKMALTLNEDDELDWQVKGTTMTSPSPDVNPYTIIWADTNARFKSAGANDAVALKFTLAKAAEIGDTFEINVTINEALSLASKDGTYVEVAYDAAAIPVVNFASTVAAPATTTAAATTVADTTVADTTAADTTAAPADDTTAAPATTKAPDKATQTGDMMFVVVAVMVVALGAAVVVKKVNVK